MHGRGQIAAPLEPENGMNGSYGKQDEKGVLVWNATVLSVCAGLPPGADSPARCRTRSPAPGWPVTSLRTYQEQQLAPPKGDDRERPIEGRETAFVSVIGDADREDVLRVGKRTD